jgi:hypothetical protein
MVALEMIKKGGFKRLEMSAGSGLHELAGEATL